MILALIIEYIAVSIGVIIILSILFMLIRDRGIGFFHVAILSLGTILMLIPIAKNINFSAGLDGISMEISAIAGQSNAKNTGLEKRIEILEASLLTVQADWVSVASSDSNPLPMLPSDNSDNTPKLNNVPLYDLEIVVLYEAEQEATGIQVFENLKNAGYAAGHHVASLASVINKQPANTIRIIFDEDKKFVALDIESRLRELSASNDNFNVEIFLDDSLPTVRNGDVQLQIF